MISDSYRAICANAMENLTDDEKVFILGEGRHDLLSGANDVILGTVAEVGAGRLVSLAGGHVPVGDKVGQAEHQ